MKMFRCFFLLFLLVSSTLPLPAQTTAPASEEVSVEDLSDRQYLGKVIELIREAKESIFVSMYMINPGTSERNPVRELLAELVEARSRGLEVRLWMNSNFPDDTVTDRNKLDSFWKELESKGIRIEWIVPEIKLHDKLIVVDREWVVEGSTNWSFFAFRKNFESSTLIRSRTLAQKKIERMKTVPVQEKKSLNRFLTTFVDLPAVLFTEKAFLPRMLDKKDREAWNLYFYLLKRWSERGTGVLEIGVKQLVPFVEGWKNLKEKKLKQRLEKILDRLEDDYRLLLFERVKDKNRVRVTLLEPETERRKKSKDHPVLGTASSSGVVRIPLAFYEYGYSGAWDLKTQFAYGVSLLLESESSNKSHWMSSFYEMERRFHVKSELLRGGLAELRKANVIDYVFSESQGIQSGLKSRFLSGYRNNLLLSEKEREKELLKVQEFFPSITPDQWKRARAYAILFDDPYDSTLVREWIELIRKYSEARLEPVIYQVAQLPIDNSIRSTQYVKQVLEKKRS